MNGPQVAEAQAANWRERLAFVFEPERVETLMQGQYEKRGEKDPDHSRLPAAGIIAAGTSKALNLHFACTTRPDAGMRANFHRTRGGSLLLDWESWVAWSEMNWPDFKQERSQREVVMRAIASESSYYNYEFSESWRWLAVKLRSRTACSTSPAMWSATPCSALRWPISSVCRCRTNFRMARRCQRSTCPVPSLW